MSSKVKVALRARPLNKREKECGAEIVVTMKGASTALASPPTEKKPPKTFTFDHCFYSVNPKDPQFASQDLVYDNLGTDVLENAFNGYNACIFAYGQTGSGKSYTMMGAPGSKGLIPKICDALFEKIAELTTESQSYKVEVSYMEIYNEKVRDLLCPKSDKHNLKVREHAALGPYVDGLSKLLVNGYADIDNLMVEGNKSRTVAATNMNAESSRSHAVFSVVMTQSQFDEDTESVGQKVSKLSLVDLAGSERASRTAAAGDRLKEGANINKSLTTLGLVISALADASSGKSSKKKGFIPYRDSVLTWLLKDNLGGNSKTVMVATVSPAGDSYEETLSTLRYADRAKRIETHAVVNEDPNAKIIRELQEEVEMLKRQLIGRGLMSADGHIREQLVESEKLMQEASLTWEQKEKQTEQIHQERHNILEKMGVSVQDTGIAVEKGRYYLVNLNADPSLNEMLVYYLKQHTRVGKPDPVAETPAESVTSSPDIQLNGLGILPEHCVLDIEDDTVYLKPFEGARTCVNGQVVKERTLLRHGDRILWGNNHFFRINCPRSSPSSATSPSKCMESGTGGEIPDMAAIDFEFAQSEIMMNEFDSLNDSMKVHIHQLEAHHEKEKQGALDKQKQKYEQQLEQLRKEKSPQPTHAHRRSASSGYATGSPSGYGTGSPSQTTSPTLLMPEEPGQRGGSPGMTDQELYEEIILHKEMLYEESVHRLREEVIKANVLVREANQLCEEMKKGVEFSVTLQIPTSRLSRATDEGALASEVAVVVKQVHRGTQVWSVDKLHSKMFDMRDMYQTAMEKSNSQHQQQQQPPTQQPDHDDSSGGCMFLEAECHTLIGVATVWLECLYQNVPLDYTAPVISQQGEICGNLTVEIKQLPQQHRTADCGDDSGASEGEEEEEEDIVEMVLGSPARVQITIKEAEGLPSHLCNFVFGQYTFFNEDPVVVPSHEPDDDPNREGDGLRKNKMIFNHSNEFVVDVDEEFIDFLTEGSLAIELYGNRGFDYHEKPATTTATTNTPTTENFAAKAAKTFVQRWKEVSSPLQLWVEIHELNEQGFYSPVELLQNEAQEAGGVFMLRQGYSRRFVVQCLVPKPPSRCTAAPVVIPETITSVAVGSVTVRSRTAEGLDSYQEADLQVVRDKFSDSVMKRRDILDQHIQVAMVKPNKTEADKQREEELLDQWVTLVEERNTLLCPPPGSGVPGATIDWKPRPGMEKYIPVVFLDLNGDVGMTGCGVGGVGMSGGRGGYDGVLPYEVTESILEVPILKYDERHNTATTSWDSSIHDSYFLNQVTPPNETVYLIVMIVVKLSHPTPTSITLRKRISVRIYNKPSIKDSLRKFWQHGNVPTRSGLTFELITRLPNTLGSGERAWLEKAVAAMDGVEAVDEVAIEKYSKGVSHVESLLNLHKLRQEVVVKEKLANVGRSSRSVQSRNLRKFQSTPNLFNLSCSSNFTADGRPLQEPGDPEGVIMRPQSQNSTGFEEKRNKRRSMDLSRLYQHSASTDLSCRNGVGVVGGVVTGGVGINIDVGDGGSFPTNGPPSGRDRISSDSSSEVYSNGNRRGLSSGTFKLNGGVDSGSSSHTDFQRSKSSLDPSSLLRFKTIMESDI